MDEEMPHEGDDLAGICEVFRATLLGAGLTPEAVEHLEEDFRSRLEAQAVVGLGEAMKKMRR